MKAILVAATIAVLGVTSAFAADLPARTYSKAPVMAPAYNWTGFYLGANGGYAWGRSNQNSVMTCGGPGACPFNIDAWLATISAAGTGSTRPEGGAVGLQLGYNIQAGTAVYGIEIDGGYFHPEKGRVAGGVTGGGLAPITPFLIATNVTTSWLLTARGRLGWTPTSNVLIYATGGVAVADVKASNSFNTVAGGLPTLGASSTTKIKAGWTAGTGIEYAINNNWSVKGEYLYIDLGSVTTTALVNNVPNVGNSNNILTTSVSLKENLVRLGVNYKFGNSAPY